MRSPALTVAVAAVVVVSLVGGAAVAGTLAADGGTDGPPSVDTPQFEDGVAPAPEDGEVTLDANAEPKTVLIDTAHANRVSDADLQPLVDTLVRNGHEVRFTRERGGDLNASLAEADAFLVVNPATRYTSEQAAGVAAFADAGGRVVVLQDPPSTRIAGGLFSISVEQVGGKSTALGSPLGVAVGSSSLYHTTENADNYESIYATPGNGPLAAGVDRVVLRDAAPVVTTDGRTALTAVEGTTLDSTRRSDTYAVAATTGDVAVVGDADFLAPANVYDADNEVLAGNVAAFLVTGDKEPGAPAEPERSGPGPGPGGPGGPAGPERPTPTPA
jgi:hypothetical protein